MIQLFIKKIQTLHKAFVATLLANAAIGTGDIIVGFLFLIGKMNFLYTISPDVAVHIEATGAFYFLSHGIIKLLLSWSLLKERIWAYPIAIVFFSFFSIYQIQELLHRFSLFVLILFIVNAAVLVMVIMEYRWIKAFLCAPPSTLKERV